ncbi:2260_t:CDS:1, partial [Ambispora gerdemannii]
MENIIFDFEFDNLPLSELIKIFNNKYLDFKTAIPIEDLISQSNNSRSNSRDKVPRPQNSFILFKRNLLLLIKKFKDVYPDFKTTTQIEALISQSNNSLSLLKEFNINSNNSQEAAKLWHLMKPE